MAQRVSGQSQLDYLWKYFGENSVQNSPDNIYSLKLQDGKLIGMNIDGEQIARIDLSGIVTEPNSSIQSFTKRKATKEDEGFEEGVDVYSLVLSNGQEFIVEADRGSETDSLIITVEDNIISGELKINNKQDSLIVLSETDQGLQVDLKPELTEKLVLLEEAAEKVIKLQEQIEKNTQDLLILKGDQEGSILQIVNSQIDKSFDWEEF